MKVIRGEKIHFVPCIYAGLGLICFLPSLYFFTKVIFNNSHPYLSYPKTLCNHVLERENDRSFPVRIEGHEPGMRPAELL